MPSGVNIKYSNKELEFIKNNCELPRVELHKIFCNKFNRSDVTIDSIKAKCQREGWKTGRTGCFNKGNKPFNKGLKQSDYISKEGMYNSSKTRFKIGNKPHNTNELFDERLDKNGYIMIKFKDDGIGKNYILKHRYLWEKQNGKLPDNCFLKCLDSNIKNTSPKNWDKVENNTKPFISGAIKGNYNYDKTPDELKPVVLTLAKLKGKKSEIVKK